MRRQPLREVIHVFQDITSLLQNELPIISIILIRIIINYSIALAVVRFGYFALVICL